MVIEINKDIDRYKESVVMGLTAKQLVCSVGSVVAGGGMVIENGKITGATGSIIIVGNFFDIMRNIISLGNDFEWRFLYGAYGSPSAVVDKIKIEK